MSVPPAFAEPLRLGAQPVVGHLDGDRTLLDLRSLAPEDDEQAAGSVTFTVPAA